MANEVFPTAQKWQEENHINSDSLPAFDLAKLKGFRFYRGPFFMQIVHNLFGSFSATSYISRILMFHFQWQKTLQ
jgi:hypothetical protein